jgi:hypothetical protein
MTTHRRKGSPHDTDRHHCLCPRSRGYRGISQSWRARCQGCGHATAACVPATAPNTWPPGPVLATRDHFAGHAEPALAVNPHDPRNVLGAAQFAWPTTFRRVPGTFYSADGGRTWHDNGPLPLPPGYDYGDDVSAVFAGGTGLVAAEIYRADGNGSGVFAWRTTDGGRRLSAPVPVYLAPAGAPHTDHPWLTAVTGPAGRPVIAVAWSEQGSLLFSRSTDGGRVFSAPRTISAPGDQYPDFAVVTPGPRQELSVVYAAATSRGKTSEVKVTTSHDAGGTFSAPTTVPGALVTAGAQPYEVSLIGASTDPRTGTPLCRVRRRNRSACPAARGHHPRRRERPLDDARPGGSGGRRPQC